MTVVFIHGVPETPSVWDGLRERIDRPNTALRLPGFGSPRPARLDGKEAYADWLANELRALRGPLDLVGHDWGAHLVMRIVSAYDVPVRSWVSDVAHGWHPDYAWHEAATLFQKTPEGEDLLASLRDQTPGSPGFGDFLRPRGMSAELATEVDTVHDQEMSTAILTLYRSAWPNLHADWGKDFDHPAQAPGLVLIPTGDPMAQPAMDLDVAGTTGAQAVELDRLTHYWMLQDPDRGADVLNRFWDSRPA
ncbi:alpha/beta hydrolase [Streptomyces triticagri]|uniref:Alpha/beta hydrolase n=1 Tax=Streptomyces triticagri TaxID=2293568 RepID=A0A372LZR2_9ACTN|nr:alpha/beta hydrolase [Streptomyces triticagri]RFU84142.1 alpha/beta hydrolase [Streptomyces triticagri]